MINLSQFRAKFPEFVSAPDAFVQVFLDTASKRIDLETWGTWENEGHGLLTAHLLVTAPNGQFSRLQSEKGESVYGREYTKLQAGSASCIRVF